MLLMMSDDDGSGSDENDDVEVMKGLLMARSGEPPVTLYVLVLLEFRKK